MAACKYWCMICIILVKVANYGFEKQLPDFAHILEVGYPTKWNILFIGWMDTIYCLLKASYLNSDLPETAKMKDIELS